MDENIDLIHNLNTLREGDRIISSGNWLNGRLTKYEYLYTFIREGGTVKPV